MHIEISADAKTWLLKKAALYRGKNRFPKIVLAVQSCRGAEFRLFFDYQQEDELLLSEAGFSFLVNQDLISKFGGFRLDVERFFFTSKISIQPFQDIKECTCKQKKI